MTKKCEIKNDKRKVLIFSEVIMEEEEGQVICSRFICWRKDDGEKKTTIVRQLLCAFVINLVGLLQVGLSEKS